MDSKPPIDPTNRFDRMCENLALMAQKTARPQHIEQRGHLNLRRDKSQHRRYHAFFDDLQN